MSQCEKTENQAEQNKSHAVAGIEAHPTPPHCCFFRNDRCNLAHADLQRGVTRCELRPPKRINEVSDADCKDNARTKDHKNFCDQDTPPFWWAYSAVPTQIAGCVRHWLSRMFRQPHRQFNERRPMRFPIHRPCRCSRCGIPLKKSGICACQRNPNPVAFSQ